MCAAIGVALAVGPAPTRAQSLKDQVRQHVEQGVERSRERKRQRKADGPHTPSDSPPPAAAADEAALTQAPAPPAPPEAPAPPPSAPERKRAPQQDTGLPVRVFGKNAQFDLTVGVGYRGWFPQQYRAAEVKVGSYWTYSVELQAKLFGWLSLRRGYYESNDIAGPRTEEAAVAAKIGQLAPKAVWLLGVLGVPISRAWEPQLRYEARAFETRADASDSVCIVARDAADDAQDCPGTRGQLKIISSFETLVAGVRYDASKSSSPVVSSGGGDQQLPLFFGVGLMQYRKPYQVTLDDFTLDNFLFDARFRGAGLALGAELPGGINRLFGQVDVQLGLGEVSLTRSLTLNELVPDGGLIGYLQGNATLGYRLALIHGPPTLIFAPTLKAGGATFFLIDTEAEQGEAASSPTVNWDFLWSVHASLLIPI